MAISPEENNAGGTNIAPGGLPAALAQTAKQTVYNEIAQPVFDPSAGPAADLYTSKYTRSSNYSLAYPKDLESSKRGHAVYFDIYEIAPVSSLSDALSTVGIKLPSSDTAVNDESGGHSVTKPNEVTTESISGTAKSTLTSFFKSVISPTPVSVTPRTKDKSVATIALYMPETLNFDYDATYNQLNLATAINATPFSSLGPAAITSFMENSATKLAMSAAGYVFNPQEQVLFEGIQFRTYEMNFTFTPSSKEETNSVNAIIKSFRYHAAPQIGGLGGFFFIPPSVFNVSFRYNGKVNPNINLLKRSVLEKVNVNYAPNGWAAFEGNGAPVQTTMSLQFKEIVLVDKTQIKEGF
jgi:hypothetical protein